MQTVVLLLCLSAVSTIFAIITMTADQMYVPVGGDVHISCKTDVKQIPLTIFNGTILMSSCSKFGCQIYDNESSSTIPVRDDTHEGYDTVSFELKNFQLKDARTYTCKERNSNSNVQDSVTITDADVPGPPSNLQSSERVTDSSVTITWLPGFDGGLPQTFIVQFRDISTVTWKEKEVKIVHLSHTIYNLQPGTKYEIKVIARNSVGNSSASEIITVTTLKSPVTKKPPPELAAIIGGVVGGVAGIGLLAIVLLVVLKFRQKDEVINSTYGGGADDQNIPADTVYSNSNKEYDQGASGDVYAVVNKPKKDIIGNSAKQIQSTGINNSSGNNRYDNHDVSTGKDMTRKNFSQGGLVYADLEFPNQPKGLKPVKQDDMTEYAEVDRTKRADPLLEVHDDGKRKH